MRRLWLGWVATDPDVIQLTSGLARPSHEVLS